MTNVKPNKSQKATTTTPDRQAQIEDQLRKWLKSIPDSRNGSMRRKWLKALARKSGRAAIAAKCLDCQAFQEGEIRRCEIIHCPLFAYRPGARKNDPTEQAIRAIAEGLLSSDSEP
jgi:hypothetical protein